MIGLRAGSCNGSEVVVAPKDLSRSLRKYAPLLQSAWYRISDDTVLYETNCRRASTSRSNCRISIGRIRTCCSVLTITRLRHILTLVDTVVDVPQCNALVIATSHVKRLMLVDNQ